MKKFILLFSATLLASITSFADILGYMDGFNGETGVANGWAVETTDHEKTLEIQFYVDDEKGADSKNSLGSATANMPRKDLTAAGYKNVNHGFTFTLPDRIKDSKPHKIYAFSIDKNKKKVMLNQSPRDFTFTKVGKTK